MSNIDYKWFKQNDKHKFSILRSIRARIWLRKHKNWENTRQKRKALNKYIGSF